MRLVRFFYIRQNSTCIFSHLPTGKNGKTDSYSTKATVSHKKLFYASHNFVNKMPFEPVFDIRLNCTCVFFTYTLAKMVIMAKLTSIPQSNTTKATVWHKQFFHTSHNFVNKL